MYSVNTISILPVSTPVSLDLPSLQRCVFSLFYNYSHWQFVGDSFDIFRDTSLSEIYLVLPRIFTILFSLSLLILCFPCLSFVLPSVSDIVLLLMEFTFYQICLVNFRSLTVSPAFLYWVSIRHIFFESSLCFYIHRTFKFLPLSSPACDQFLLSFLSSSIWS